MFLSPLSDALAESLARFYHTLRRSSVGAVASVSAEQTHLLHHCRTKRLRDLTNQQQRRLNDIGIATVLDNGKLEDEIFWLRSTLCLTYIRLRLCSFGSMAPDVGDRIRFKISVVSFTAAFHTTLGAVLSETTVTWCGRCSVTGVRLSI